MADQVLPETSQKTSTDFKMAVAVKARISDLIKGKWQEKFLEMPNGENISRARVMATVVAKFLSEDGKYSSLTLDDSTGNIRAKNWDNIKLFESVQNGDVIDLIGKIKFYNGEVYLVPEILRKVTDTNFEALRQLELVKKYGPADSSKTEKIAESPMNKIDVRKHILKIIEESKDGISYPEILEKVNGSRAEIEQIIDDLLLGGLCYESSPGVIKKI